MLAEGGVDEELIQTKGLYERGLHMGFCGECGCDSSLITWISPLICGKTSVQRKYCFSPGLKVSRTETDKTLYFRVCKPVSGVPALIYK